MNIVGRMNSLVYPVEGGMEDWMYAAGWDKATLKKCNDYDTDKQQGQQQKQVKEKKDLTTTISFNVTNTYNNDLDLLTSSGSLDVENRAMVFLIETSDAKRPKDSQLGGDKEVSIV